MSYDPELRRDTPLALKLKERIGRDGPLAVHDYMQACLADPDHGYYRRMPVIGAGGDFVTAPEISQVFGELIGLWTVVVWDQMGRPARLRLIELGPGRGTLMRDALRAARVAPGFLEAVTVGLVESNDRLAALQMETLSGCGAPIAHVEGADDPRLPPGPTIILANEFLDCLPVQQFVWQTSEAGTGWHGRTVALDADGRLCFGHDGKVHRRCASTELAAVAPHGADGDILECTPGHARLADAIAPATCDGRPLAALLVDYGHTASAVGDTLQAVQAHRFVGPLLAPGETDLTAQVDFASLARALERRSSDAPGRRLTVDGPTTQAEFLGRLGIVERTSRLMGANAARAGALEAATARLMAPNGMGTRFKVLGVRRPEMAMLPGF